MNVRFTCTLGRGKVVVPQDQWTFILDVIYIVSIVATFATMVVQSGCIIEC